MCWLPVGVNAAEETAPASSSQLSVADFLPGGYVTDGSVSYQTHLQRAIDTAGRRRATLVFPPMTYLLGEEGLRLCSGVTYSMYGAVFDLGKSCSSDGQAFVGEDLRDVRLLGGEIVGHHDVWAEGVNLRGVYLKGATSNVRIRDLHTRGLSSNGVGVFGDEDRPARDVWVTDCVLEDGCNFYGDYLTDRGGPEKGSVREDQGLIACYHVRDFVVRGCRFEKSRSDGTHFYKCRRGQIVHNRIYAAQMGGFFLETCHDVLASDNVIRDNGSRGATIERGSRNCIFRGNVVAGSGREGLWAPNCVGLVVTGNVFDRNGRKPNGDKPHLVWNANITINAARVDPSKSPTEDYLVSDNLLYTTSSQIAAMRIDADVSQGVVVTGNLLRGENREILVEGGDKERVTLEGNR
ncbi:MAG: right-handed parallel beta-helix repeat-containing protein [Pirellulaceae bacterium]